MLSAVCKEKRNRVGGVINSPKAETFIQKTWSTSVALNHIPAAEADHNVSASMWINRAMAPGADLRGQIVTAISAETAVEMINGMA